MVGGNQRGLDVEWASEHQTEPLAAVGFGVGPDVTWDTV